MGNLGGIFGAPSGGGYGPPASVYGITPTWLPPTKTQQFMDKLGGLFGASSPAQASLFSGDPQEAKRRSLMAAGMQMLAASGPQNKRQSAGQILSQGYLAGQKANDEYLQDMQRRQYLSQMSKQQEMEMEKQRRTQMLEEQRGKTMAGAQFSPEALEAKAGELYAAGDIAGAEGAFDMAAKIRQAQVSETNARTNQMIAERGLQPQIERGDDGFYRKNPDGTMTKVAGWQQFSPGAGGAGKPGAADVPAQEAEVIKQQLQGQISRVLSWAEGDGGSMLGSPKAGARWDATVGQFFGTEDSQMRRDMDMLINRQILDLAKYLKPMSASDVTFLEKSMPTQDDSPATKARWLRDFAKRSGIDLGSGGSVFDKYGLTPPGGAPAAAAPATGVTRSW
jgi:hypothetical protein